ncbi:hypothetical protein ACTFIV_001357 [Dictyostelium citrinum]
MVSSNYNKDEDNNRVNTTTNSSSPLQPPLLSSELEISTATPTTLSAKEATTIINITSLSSLTSPSLLPTDPIELEVYLIDHLPLKDISKMINMGDILAKEFSRFLVILIKSDDRSCFQQQPPPLVQLFWNFGLNDYNLNQNINSFFSIHNLSFFTPRMVDSIQYKEFVMKINTKSTKTRNEQDEKKLKKVEEQHTQEKECNREEKETINKIKQQPIEDFNNDEEEIGHKLSKKHYHRFIFKQKKIFVRTPPPLNPVSSLIEAKCYAAGQSNHQSFFEAKIKSFDIQGKYLVEFDCDLTQQLLCEWDIKNQSSEEVTKKNLEFGRKVLFKKDYSFWYGPATIIAKGKRKFTVTFLKKNYDLKFNFHTPICYY